MEKNLINVKITYESIANGSIPASFVDVYTLDFNPIIYETRSGKNAKCTFRVKIKDTISDQYIQFVKKYLTESPEQLPAHIHSEIITLTESHKGKVRDSVPTKITTGKNLGKSNATNVVTQAIKQAMSMYIKKSHRDNENKDNILLPMLVLPINKTRAATLSEEELASGVIIERKFDGVRALINKNEDGSINIMSRTGHNYVGLTHIEEEVKKVLTVPNIYLDGELYIHGKKLQNINKIIMKASNSERSLVKFYIFDVVVTERGTTDEEINISDVGAQDRKFILKRLLAPHKLNALILVDYEIVHTMEDIERIAIAYINEGYEGAIIRRISLSYEPGYNNYHSANVLKVKPRPDAEYKVIGYTKGTKGKGEGAILFVCATETGLEFTSMPKDLTDAERIYLYKRLGENKLYPTDEDLGITIFEQYIKDRFATIEYSTLSENNIPLQSKFKCMRLEHGETDAIAIITSEL